jgi:hypothetical protein
MGMLLGKITNRSSLLTLRRRSYEFDENEVVLCLQNMQLEATSDPAGRKAFIVAGTSVNRAEDMSTKGNVSAGV